MPEPLFSRYDTADYLKTEADVVAYLDAVMAEGSDDPALIAHALGVVARAHNISKLAARHRNEPRGPLQSSVRRRKPQFCHDSKGR